MLDRVSNLTSPIDSGKRPSFSPESIAELPVATLRDELHARTYPVFQCPVTVCSYSFIRTDATVEEEKQHAHQLCVLKNLSIQSQTRTRLEFVSEQFELRIDYYKEFTCYLFIFPQRESADFKHKAMNIISGDWFDGIPGLVLTQTNFIVHSIGDKQVNKQKLLEFFGNHQIIGSTSAHGVARVWSNFKVDADQSIRILIENIGLGPRRAGRLIQRMIDLENYRMMALLSLPLAQKTLRRLEQLESSLTQLVTRVSSDDSVEEEKALLDDLFHLASEGEQLRAKSLHRFSASRAYQEIMEERLSELDDTSIEGYQTISRFFTRRMKPALRTIESAQQRLENLSRHIQRVTDMLSTRVSVNVEEQNQKMLESVADQSRRQLRLQQTVEGLSIIAVTYYASSLLSYLFKSMEKMGYGISPYLLTGLSVPVIGFTAWLGLKWLKKKALKED
jgi:uncharacterized membrane-anchored protein